MEPFVTRSLIRCSLVAALALIVGLGCNRGSDTGSAGVVGAMALFEHGAVSVANHPFPSDEYIDQSFFQAERTVLVTQLEPVLTAQIMAQGVPAATAAAMAKAAAPGMARRVLPGLLATPFIQARKGIAVNTDDGGFSMEQQESMNFLKQLGATAQTGVAVTTQFRFPFTLDKSRPGSKIDVATAPGAFMIYDVTDAQATWTQALKQDDFYVSGGTNAVVFRPRVPLTPGRTYGVVLLAGKLKTISGGGVVPSPGYETIRAANSDPETKLKSIIDDPSKAPHGSDESFEKITALDPNVNSRADTLAYVEVTTKVDVDAAALKQGKIRSDTQEMVKLRDAVNGKAKEYVVSATTNATSTIALAAAGIGVAEVERVFNTRQDIDSYFVSAGGEALTALNIAINKIVVGRFRAPNFVSDTVFDPQAILTNSTFHTMTKTLDQGPRSYFKLSAARPFHEVPYVAFFPPVSDTTVAVGLHDFSRDKNDFLTVANFINSTGKVLIAIDAYQHGSTRLPHEGDFSDKVDPLLAVLGVQFPDPFLGTTFLARTRDKFRQTMVDTLALVRLLTEAKAGAKFDFDGDGNKNESIDLDGDTAPDAYGNISILGMGLGSIVGTAVTAVSDDVTTAVLNTSGGGLASLFRESASFAPSIGFQSFATASAEGFGLAPGSETPFYSDSAAREVYDIVFQAALAPVDPLTYGSSLLNGGLRATGTKPAVLTQFVQGDAVIPNAASARFARAVDVGGKFVQFLTNRIENEVQSGIPLDLGETAWASSTMQLGSGTTQFSSASTHAALVDTRDPAFAEAVGEAVQYLKAGVVGK
ncbi:hypothetical protein ACFL59_08415 [Planctomycetota bacterium]